MPPKSAMSDADRPINPSQSLIQLPLELKCQIVKQLDIKDRMNLRLASRHFAVISQTLFPSGLISVRPQYDDMDKLEAISQHPTFPKHIIHLQLFVGDVLKSEVDRGISIGSSHSYSNRKEKDAMKEFEPMFEPSRSGRHCDGQVLSDIIARLPKLTTIVATSAFPFAGLPIDFKEKFGNKIGKNWTLPLGPSGHPGNPWQDFALSMARYPGIIFAAQHTTLPLQKLALDPLPLDCFTDEFVSENGDVSRIVSPGLKTLIADLKDFRFGVVSKVPRAYAKRKVNKALTLQDLPLAQQLGDFFGLMPHLRNLDLGWHLNNHSPPFFSKFKEAFYQNYWPHLTSLRLSNMETDPKQLLLFLRKHTSTLRCLHLNWEALDLKRQKNQPACSHKMVLNTLKKDLKLDKLQYLTGPMEDEIYDADWTPIIGKPDPILKNPAFMKMFVPNPAIKDAKLLELYVLEKLLWPMTKSNRVRGCDWPRLPKMDIIAKLTDKATAEDRELFNQLEDDYEDSESSGSDGSGSDGW